MHAYSAPLTTTLLLLPCCLRRSGEGPLLVAVTPCCVGSSVGIRCTNNYRLYPSPSCLHSQPLPPEQTYTEGELLLCCLPPNQGVVGPVAVMPCPKEIPTRRLLESHRSLAVHVPVGVGPCRRDVAAELVEEIVGSLVLAMKF